MLNVRYAPCAPRKDLTGGNKEPVGEAKVALYPNKVPLYGDKEALYRAEEALYGTQRNNVAYLIIFSNYWRLKHRL